MLSWFGNSAQSSASVSTNAQGILDDTELEAPETPAPVFAVRAFKYALFGTPKPGIDGQLLHTEENKRTEPTAKDEISRPSSLHRATRFNEDSPTKPNSILMTPRAGTSRKKNVSFPAHVVDNEGKTSSFAARLATPKAVPGKFPSPFTPKTRPLLQTSLEDEKTISKETILKANAPDPLAVSNQTERSNASPAKPRAKDDTDLTIDIVEPRSESGRYWKEQYISYSTKSEKEMKKLVSKHQLAKSYAKRKDEEAMVLTSKLSETNREHRVKGREMSEQMKELKRQLLRGHDEITRLTAEMTILKRRLNESSPAVTPHHSSDVWADHDLQNERTKTEAPGDEVSLVLDRRFQALRPQNRHGRSRTGRVARQILRPRDANLASPADQQGDGAQVASATISDKSLPHRPPCTNTPRMAGVSRQSTSDVGADAENRPPNTQCRPEQARVEVRDGNLPTAPAGFKEVRTQWEPSSIPGMDSEIDLSRLSRINLSRTPLPQEKTAAARARLRARRDENAARRKKA
ncbi:hypothetical protein P152DRAFT_472938 [Eremomyces bilateralis CBS 781.70]|uniref:Spindle pole body-associated protein cut12 domain-containing protein n=1 Tax=Eremomyces bilateralis CBS 781.70 TaxID=1392243 RepID=A0A6G1G589_9PEZI|nr:uncharacterized protein P152DRAFT_472938 [Eremomyces bilateralis CBS 781.70]KAF1813188.1 hypothetical protein P152DRAFT_472938 [Eremomyces bilateralis CBS 781.70]